MKEKKTYQITEEEDRILREAAEKYPLGSQTKCETTCTMSMRDKWACCGCPDVNEAARYLGKNIESAGLTQVFKLYGKSQKLRTEIANIEKKLAEKKKCLKQAEAILKEHVVVVKKEGI